MGLFDRRKDVKPGMPAVPEEPTTEEPTVSAAPPSPPAPPVAEPAPEPGQPEPPPAAPAPAAEEAQSQSDPAIHTVADGESLADLATRYGVPAEEIARQNHVPAPGQIHAGQVFVIRR